MSFTEPDSVFNTSPQRIELQMGLGSSPTAYTHHGTNGDGPAPKASLKGKPRAQFLIDIPAREYLLPGGGPINATLVELIVLLPQWFRNVEVAWRFLNSGINAAVHFVILEQHRHLSLASTEEAERARDHISDAYRKTMRRVIPGWTKAKHKVPGDWNELNISIANFVPEAARTAGYVAPPPIPFKDMAIGLKKLPQGYDAGDLTRALDFALRNQKLDENGQSTEFMFPDDIQLILSHIGPTPMTRGHLDAVILSRYSEVLRAAEGERRKELAEKRRLKQAAENATARAVHHSYPDQFTPSDGLPTTPFAQQRLPPAPNFSSSNLGMGVLIPSDTVQHPRATEDEFQNLPQGLWQTQPQILGYEGTSDIEPDYSYSFQPHPARSNAQEAAAAVASELMSQGAQQALVDFPDIPDICKSESIDPIDEFFSDAWLHLDPQEVVGEMDALVAANQGYDFNDFYRSAQPSLQPRSLYHPDAFLRECPEGLDPNDFSELACASRWARQYRYPHDEFRVADIGAVLAIFEMP